MKITDIEKENIFNILQGGTKALEVYFDILNKEQEIEIKQPELNKGKIFNMIFSTMEGIGLPMSVDMQRQFRGKFNLDEGVWRND